MSKVNNNQSIQSNKVPSYIRPFVAGDEVRTPLVVEDMNEIVAVLNALLNAKGINGIKIYKSDANFVISYEPEDVPTETKPTESAPTTEITEEGPVYNCACRYS